MPTHTDPMLRGMAVRVTAFTKDVSLSSTGSRHKRVRVAYVESTHVIGGLAQKFDHMHSLLRGGVFHTSAPGHAPQAVCKAVPEASALRARALAGHIQLSTTVSGLISTQRV
jgi:hypothetical protein